jgi:signal transduction histidine kinase
MNLTTVADKPACSIPDIASIVHDLRNPLSAIHGSAQMLIGSELSELQIQRIARNLYGASVRLKELLDEFLNRYRGTHERIECADLRELVAGSVEKIKLLAEAQGVQVVLQVPANVAIVVDKHRIQRALVNLFVNALDVMPEGGLLKVSASAGTESVVIKIRDTGPGIAPEMLGRIFQPYATAGKPRGLGLGLALSRQAVMDHGGQMWVEFGGRGACFAVRLPIFMEERVGSC